MLPEQVWDYADMPEKGLYFGQSAYSAQPLVWAHAEYIKLLRSSVDGRVFDRISVVEERYGVVAEKRTFRNTVEFFQVTRPLAEVPRGHKIQVLDRAMFRVVWTTDGWKTQATAEAQLLGVLGFSVVLPLEKAPVGVLEFAMHWMAEDRWTASNYKVNVV